MVRLSVGFKPCDQQELKTLKLPKSTLEVVRQPSKWTRPSSGLYDYHYEIGGLYYQPMLNYCIEREKGGERRNVVMPDRIMSNFDKRAFVPSGSEIDYEDFLAGVYQRKIRVDNTKTIDCSKKLLNRSKENTRLNDYRDSAQQRDKYMCQIQMYHTGTVAQKDSLMKGQVGDADDADTIAEKRRMETQEEKDQRMIILGINKDDRYGPAFKKVTCLNSHDKSWQPLDEFFKHPKEEEAMEAAKEKMETSSSTTQSSKVTRIVVDGSGEVVEQSSSSSAGYKPIVGKEMLEAETLNDWVKARVEGGAKRLEKPTPKPLYIDTGYAKALDYVQERVRVAGEEPGQEKLTTKNFNYFYGNRKAEDIGKHSRAAITAHIMASTRIPDFDVGYDTINSIKEARVIR